MTSPYGNSRSSLDGTRLAIHTHLTRPSIDAKLWDVRRNRKFVKLSFTGALGVHGYQQQQPLHIGRSLAQAMAELLCCDERSWERIDFEHCTGELDVIIATGLANNRVQALCFSEVTLSPSTSHSLATGLKINKSVSELRLRRCRPAESVSTIGEGIGGNVQIQSLTVEQCNLSDEQIASLVSSLQDCTNLHKLSLEGNHCRALGMTELASLLRNSKLQNLSLHNQKIEGASFLDVSPLVGSLSDANSSLKFLDMSRNALKDEDVGLLFSGLMENTTLETLHLDQNHITDAGAKVIAESLPCLRVMKRLALPENPFGETGALSILAAIQGNYSLETLIIPSGSSHIQKKIRWYGNLNKGGRKLFKTPRDAALALYPLVLERVNKMRLTHDWNPSHAPADVIYGLLRLGPILFEQKGSQQHNDGLL